jgi:ankyrin repeat protein
VNSLIAHGARIDAKDKIGLTAMSYAHTQRALMHALLEKGANPSDALSGVVASGDEDLLTALLKRGADPNTNVRGAGSLLHYARMRKRPQIIAILIKAGARE